MQEKFENKYISDIFQ